MYEAEVNHQVEGPETIPANILARFREYRDRVEARTLLPWGEHCTECAWPSCYTSCDLYEARVDGNCRQFTGGVVRIPFAEGTTPYIQKITFRRWAKLWTLGNVQCYSLSSADLAERTNIFIGSAARLTPVPGAIRHRVLNKVAYLRRQHLAERINPGQSPDYLVCEIYNPTDRPVNLTMSVRERGRTAPAFQRLIAVNPGFWREKVPVTDITTIVAVQGVIEVELVPNDPEGLTLYFGLLDFVKEKSLNGASVHYAQATETPKATCKCVVWDLDHTLWNGILVEDGAEQIQLRDGIVDVVKELDRRGILQSVASKNNHEDAVAALEKLGIAEYFLHPQIHWQPKSKSIGAIAEALNIGVDTLMFVDDQEFERREVASAWPEVTVVDSNEFARLPERPECQVPVTDESRTRRLMYREQEQRVALQQSYKGDYLAFLRESGIQLELAPLRESSLERVYELAQRTNQMNFSGNRYSKDALQRMMDDNDVATFVLRCADRFGSYGIVGFAVVRVSECRLLDLMFSCRVQSKRVEHGFLAWLLRKYSGDGEHDFLANLRKTKKNGPSSAVFAEMGFDEASTADGVTTLRFQKEQPIRDDGIVSITVVDQ